MQVNFKHNFSTHRNKEQSFGAIKADDKAIQRLTEFVSNNENRIFKLNELITSQAKNTEDIFLSTDKFNKLTTKIGFADNAYETPSSNPIQIIEEAINFLKSFERHRIMKSNVKLEENISKYGHDEGINQLMNKIRIDL